MEGHGTTSHSGRGHSALGGIVAGMIGGIAIALFLIIGNLASGRSVWQGLKGAGTPFLHERAAQPGFDLVAVVVGVLSHFAVSIVWGVLFALVFYGLSRGATMVAGVFWGIVVWLGMFYVVLPLVGMGQVAQTVPVGVAVFEHVLFGVALALGFLPFQEPRHGRARGGRHPVFT
ncbi:MAG: hypothetical protein JWO36_611 [Myxococcales bacterium]|nr:hypothetical protein [Myxococcales bacterium]